MVIKVVITFNLMSKHKPTSDVLRAEIETGKYASDRRLPSEEALCRIHGQLSTHLRPKVRGKVKICKAA